MGHLGHDSWALGRRCLLTLHHQVVWKGIYQRSQPGTFPCIRFRIGAQLCSLFLIDSVHLSGFRFMFSIIVANLAISTSLHHFSLELQQFQVPMFCPPRRQMFLPFQKNMQFRSLAGVSWFLSTLVVHSFSSSSVVRASIRCALQPTP